jgi:hypothetical protein
MKSQMTGCCQDCGERAALALLAYGAPRRDSGLGGDDAPIKVCRGCLATREAIYDASMTVAVRRSARLPSA